MRSWIELKKGSKLPCTADEVSGLFNTIYPCRCDVIQGAIPGLKLLGEHMIGSRRKRQRHISLFHLQSGVRPVQTVAFNA